MSRRGALGIAVLIAAFLLLSWSDGHYWDEYYYLYSTLIHTPAELLRFESGTQHFPPGFFSEKLGHVFLLERLTAILGGGERALYAIQLLYALLLVGFVAGAYGLMLELLGDRRAALAALVLLFSPLALYLSFKVMSEVPSLLFITLGSWAFVRSFRPASPRAQTLWLALAITGLAVGMLCRVTMIVSFAGLGLALLLAGDERFDRPRLFWRLVVGGLAVIALHIGVVQLAGGSVHHTGLHIRAVISGHPPLQRVYALGLFLQAFALLLPFAWTARADGRPRLAFVWLLVASLPFVVGHEPRYYAPALVPLAMVAAAGLRGATDLLFPAKWRYAWVGLLAGLVLVNRFVLVPLMPYEVSQRRLLEVFKSFHDREPTATYLVPWSSDFSLLRFAFPRANVVLCLTGSAASRHGMTGARGPLSAADQWWAGAGHYVGTDSALVGRAEPWYYIGWERNPSAVRLGQLLGYVGLDRLLRQGPELHNHLEESWIWSDDSWRLILRRQEAQYRVYEVTPRPPPGG
jgi:4-amino-4-deoxy-L-arabinose transferase-like glycosyltransferase